MKDVDLYHDDCEFVLIGRYNKLKNQLKEAEKVIDSLEINLLHELNYTEWLEAKSELAEYKAKYNDVDNEIR